MYQSILFLFFLLSLSSGFQFHRNFLRNPKLNAYKKYPISQGYYEKYIKRLNSQNITVQNQDFSEMMIYSLIYHKKMSKKSPEMKPFLQDTVLLSIKIYFQDSIFKKKQTTGMMTTMGMKTTTFTVKNAVPPRKNPIILKSLPNVRFDSTISADTIP